MRNQIIKVILLAAPVTVIALQVAIPESSDGLCPRQPVDVVLFTHLVNPRIVASVNRMAADMKIDCGLSIWVAWGGSEDALASANHSFSANVKTILISPSSLQQALESQDDLAYVKNWGMLRQISVPLLWRVSAVSEKKQSGYVWVFENDAEVPGSISRFVRYYEQSEEDYVASMVITQEEKIEKRYKDSIVIQERGWRGNECKNVHPAAYNGPGSFVMVSRFSLRFLDHLKESVLQQQWCYVEKFFMTLCNKFRLRSRSLAWPHLGWLNVQFAGTPALMAAISRDASQRDKVYHPLKFKQNYNELEVAQAPDWSSISPAHQHCQSSRVYTHAEFSDPDFFAACSNGCWIVNSSDANLLCTQKGVQKRAARNPMSIYVK